MDREVFPDGVNEFSLKAEEQASTHVEVTPGVYTASPSTPSSASTPISGNMKHLK